MQRSGGRQSSSGEQKATIVYVGGKDHLNLGIFTGILSFQFPRNNQAPEQPPLCGRGNPSDVTEEETKESVLFLPMKDNSYIIKIIFLHPSKHS